MDLNKSKIRLKSQEEIDKKLQEFSGREHLYSIALFDIKIFIRKDVFHYGPQR